MKRFTNARYIIKDLNRARHEAFIVGGAVRDYLLKIEITDIDLTTGATPGDMLKLFPETIPTGIKFGTVTVIIDGEHYQVTTFRTDGKTLDNRHPSGVYYTKEVTEDVKRRDFTINGMLMDYNGTIIDHVGGRIDLKAKLIRAIGDPNERFAEDALRIMRAFYFQSKLGFQIEKETRNAMSENRELLLTIANERILDELFKMFKGKHVKNALQSIRTTRVDEVLPGLKKGITYVLDELQEVPYLQTFFALSFYLNGSVPNEWTFSNRDRHFYNRIIELIPLSRKGFTPRLVYDYGVELCTVANRVNGLLKLGPNQHVKIQTLFETLTIKSRLDLKVTARQMMEITKRKQGAWLTEVQDEIIELILIGKLQNTDVAITKFLEKKEW